MVIGIGRLGGIGLAGALAMALGAENVRRRRETEDTVIEIEVPMHHEMQRQPLSPAEMRVQTDRDRRERRRIAREAEAKRLAALVQPILDRAEAKRQRKQAKRLGR